MSESTARGALSFAFLVGGCATIIWLILKLSGLPAPGPVTGSDDPEVRLCDRAVDALLHSKELIEVERAAAIVSQIPCGIGRRL